MKNPSTAPWDLPISRSDVEKLKQGFKPAAMEDRWKCHADVPPDARGDFVVHLHRSWTGDEVFRMNVVVLAAPENGEKVASANTGEPHARIADITWDRGDGTFLDSEDKAKEVAAGVCRGVMGCDF